MAFVGPLDSFNSKPIQTKVGTSQTNIFTATSTKVTRDVSGKVTGGTTTLNFSTDPGNYVPAATTTDGGKTWTYLKDSSGKEILGADAKKSLEQGALKTNTQNQIVSATTKGPLGGGGLTPEEQKVVAPSTKNNATTTEGGDPNNAALISDLSTPKTETRLSFPNNLRYPLQLKLENQDVIEFNMLKYEPRKANEGGTSNLGTFGQRSNYTSRTIGRVTLPIPSGISDSNNVNWGSEDITSAQKALADLATAGITGGGGEAAKTAENQVDAGSAAAGEIKTGLAAYFTEQAVGVRGILSRTQGAVQNPNMELLFNGPQLRPFNFVFKFSARSKREAEAIRSIIRFFKQGMAPQTSPSNLFLKAPNTFKIRYLHQNKEHKFINRIKECALQSFSVDYTPEGQYATFTDGAMVSYQVTMQFTELEPIFNEDYTELDKNADTEIGY
jgi:hypothetical protein